MQAQPPAPPESLSGLIERVTFFNEENGFAVLKVKAKGHRDEVTVVGSLPAVNAGEWVTAEGRWVRDRDFGLQFRAEGDVAKPATGPVMVPTNTPEPVAEAEAPETAKAAPATAGEKPGEVVSLDSFRKK